MKTTKAKKAKRISMESPISMKNLSMTMSLRDRILAVAVDPAVVVVVVAVVVVIVVEVAVLQMELVAAVVKATNLTITASGIAAIVHWRMKSL
jgi:hypothetical protein